MKIYIVEGQTGEWSDATQWAVKAFGSRAKANKLKNKLNKIASGVSGYYYEKREKVGKELQAAGDPHAYIYSTGTVYTVYSLEYEA